MNKTIFAMCDILCRTTDFNSIIAFFGKLALIHQQMCSQPCDISVRAIDFSTDAQK